jgi:hypothetical protein
VVKAACWVRNLILTYAKHALTPNTGVVIMRSDVHLREVLRTYERKYQGNFARDALRKSNNLVVWSIL